MASPPPDARRALRSLLGPPLRRARRALGRDRARRGDAVVLMYHRVAELEHDPWRLAVSPARFAEHVELVRERFRPLSLPQLADGLRSGRLPRRSAVVTFDDGYRDNLVAAKPVLERHGVPATVFVVSGYVDSQRGFWWDELERLCREPAAAAAGLEYQPTWQRLRALPRAEREAELDALWASVGAEPLRDASTMSCREVVELAASGLVRVGAHTDTHPVLPWLDRAGQLAEMRQSRRTLEAILGRPVDTFSYPHGAHDAVSVACAAESGFRCACTSEARAATGGTSPLAIPRVVVGDWPADELERRLDPLLR